MSAKTGGDMIAKTLSSIARAIGLGFAVLALALGSTAIRAQSSHAPRCLRPGAPFNAQDLSAFLDNELPRQLRRSGAVGATVAVVGGGKVLATRGYGSSDAGGATPVDPDRSTFPIASVSKSMLTVAILQMVEQGKFDLDEDVNRYLDFKIAEPYGRITIRNLLTHSSGLRIQEKETVASTSASVPSLRDWVMESLPPQVRAPGDRVVYSNNGFALMAYMVERATGKPIELYMRDNVFSPLGMTHTGYRRGDKWFAPRPVGVRLAAPRFRMFNRLEAIPGGGVETTANDLARFMLMLINRGTLDGHRIVSSASIDAMFARQYGGQPGVPTMGFALYGADRYGVRIMEHEGTFTEAIGLLAITPDCGVGLALAMVGTRKNVEGDALLTRFIQRYFSVRPPPIQQGIAPADIAGRYSADRSWGTIGQMSAIANQALLSVGADGAITISEQKTADGVPRRYLPVGGGLYTEQDGRADVLIAPRGASHELRYVTRPIHEGRRVGWFERLEVVETLAVFALGVAAVGVARSAWLLVARWASLSLRMRIWESWMGASAVSILSLGASTFYFLNFIVAQVYSAVAASDPWLIGIFAPATAVLGLAVVGPLLSPWAWHVLGRFDRLMAVAQVLATWAVCWLIVLCNLASWQPLY